MSRILRRPMFRGGPINSYNTGIASGLGDEGYADGGRVSARVGGFFSKIPFFSRPTSGAPVEGGIPTMSLKDLVGISDASKSVREFGRFTRPYLAANPFGAAIGLGLGATGIGRAPGYFTDSSYEVKGGEEEQFIKDYGAEILGKETSTGEAIKGYYLTKNQKRAADLLKRGGPGDKEEAEKLINISENIIKSSTPQTIKETQPKEKSELDKLKEFYEKQLKDEREKYKLKLEGLQTPKLTEEEEITKQTELYQKLLGGEEARSQAAYDALLAAAPAFFKGRNLREAAPQVLESINKSGAFDKPRDIRQAAAQLAIQRRILLDKSAAEEKQRLAILSAKNQPQTITEQISSTAEKLGTSFENAANLRGPEYFGDAYVGIAPVDKNKQPILNQMVEGKVYFLNNRYISIKNGKLISATPSKI